MTKLPLWVASLGFAVLALFTGSVYAQDYGLTIGVHESTAVVDTGGLSTAVDASTITGSSSGLLGFDAGLTASFELMPDFRFRSGILYDQRPFSFKATNATPTVSANNSPAVGTYTFNFSYIDVPVQAQFNFTPMIGIYGGLIVGVNVSDSIAAPNGLVIGSSTTTALYPLLNGGLNFMFNDMIGIDLFYEYGLGNINTYLSNYSTFGMHFIYWL